MFHTIRWLLFGLGYVSSYEFYTYKVFDITFNLKLRDNWIMSLLFVTLM